MIRAIILSLLCMFTAQGMETSPTALTSTDLSNGEFALVDILTNPEIIQAFEQHAAQLISTLTTNSDDISLTCTVHKNFSASQTNCLLFAVLHRAFFYQEGAATWKLQHLNEIFNFVYGSYMRRQTSLEDCIKCALSSIPLSLTSTIADILENNTNWPGRLFVLAYCINQPESKQESLLLSLRSFAHTLGFTLAELKNQAAKLPFDVIENTLSNSTVQTVSLFQAQEILSLLLQDNKACLDHYNKHRDDILKSLVVKNEFVDISQLLEKAQAIRKRHVCSKFWRVASWTKEHLPTPQVPAFKLFAKK